jgi:hypoxanthine phosphoribosyltransferase
MHPEADLLHSESEINAAYDRLAAALERDYFDKNPLILCVMVGGLFTTSEVLKRVSFPLQLDYLHATRYRGETSGSDLVWKVHPSFSLAGRHVLIIDDILDEGPTLAAIQKQLRAEAPASLKTLVLCEKVHSRKDPAASADYIGLQVEDRYVFGCGMDCREYGRQLPAIYAVKGM